MKKGGGQSNVYTPHFSTNVGTSTVLVFVCIPGIPKLGIYDLKQWFTEHSFAPVISMEGGKTVRRAVPFLDWQL